MLQLMIVAILLLMIVVILAMQRIEEDIIKRYDPQGGFNLDKSEIRRHHRDVDEDRGLPHSSLRIGLVFDFPP